MHLRMMDPVVLYYGKGQLTAFLADPRGVLDVVISSIFLMMYYLTSFLILFIYISVNNFKSHNCASNIENYSSM